MASETSTLICMGGLVMAAFVDGLHVQLHKKSAGTLLPPRTPQGRCELKPRLQREKLRFREHWGPPRSQGRGGMGPRPGGNAEPYVTLRVGLSPSRGPAGFQTLSYTMG